MGIKDNFSQAVKELWKKDGQESQPEPSAPAQPSELDRYLQASQTAQDAQAAQPVQPVSSVQSAAAQTVSEQTAAPVQNDPAQEVQAAQQPVQPAMQANTQGVPLETPYYRAQPQNAAPQVGYQQNNAFQNSGYNNFANPANNNGYNNGFGGSGNFGGSGGFVPPSDIPQQPNETDEVTVISKNTIIDGNIRSLANMQIDGSIKGNVETTRNIDMTGKVIGDVACNNAGMNSAAMQGNVSIKGRMRMDRDTILIGDLTSQYADINGRIRGKLDIAGKAELKRDAIVFGDISASTIAVTDGAIIQGYVNTTFLSKEDGRNIFPEAISLDSKETTKS